MFFKNKSTYEIPEMLRRENKVIKEQKKDRFFQDLYKQLAQLQAIRVALRNELKRSRGLAHNKSAAA